MAIICPICDRAVGPNEGLVIRPAYDGYGKEFMRVLHVDYSQPVTKVRTLCESDEYTRLAIDF